VTTRFRLYLHIDELQDLGRPRWDSGYDHENHRELHLAVGDVRLVFSEPVARCLREMLAAIVPPAPE
jgi:hypothetical protein